MPAFNDFPGVKLYENKALEREVCYSGTDLGHGACFIKGYNDPVDALGI